MSDVLTIEQTSTESNASSVPEVAKGFGEVVETSLTTYMAQCFELDRPPPFGGLVRVNDREKRCVIYGVVYHIATGGIDPTRRAAVRTPSNANATDEQVYDANPQLSRLLKTEFGVVVLGCRRISPDGEIGRIQYIFPDYPPPLHFSVHICDDAELIEFTEQPHFLRTLINSAQAPVEELTAALLRRGTEAREETGREWLVDTGRALARLLKEDYDKLRTILEKCEGV
jgi:hypothetical protein